MSWTKPPVSFWIISVISLLWNSIGALDYTMTQTRNADYMAEFTPDQLEYFTSFPPVMEAAWAFGVWGAVLGSVLLLLRSKFAVWSFALSLLGLLVSTYWQFFGGALSAYDVLGSLSIVMTAVIWVIAIALFFYARRMHAKGVLR